MAYRRGERDVRAAGTLTLVVTGLVLVAVLQAAAQQQPADIVGRRIEGQTGNPNPYFQATPQPYQSSYARRMQRQMQELWGNTTAGRGVPSQQWAPIYLPPPRDLIFVHPPQRPPLCPGSRGCYRFYRRGWGWRGW